MRLFAAVADKLSFTGAADALGVPKQTVSRRVAALESELGVRLLDRTMGDLQLTDVGQAYATRCARVVELADDANQAVVDAGDSIRGILRITADPIFGEAFLADLVHDYMADHPAVEVELMLTQRKVDLVEEGYDLAFRVGAMADSSLVATALGPASMTYCASPSYLEARGTPRHPNDLRDHDCIALLPEQGASRWLFVVEREAKWFPIQSRLRVNHLPTARRLAVADSGIVNLPTFAAKSLIDAGLLAPVLTDFQAPFGDVRLVYLGSALLAPRTRAFIDLAVDRFRRDSLLPPPEE